MKALALILVGNGANLNEVTSLGSFVSTGI